VINLVSAAQLADLQVWQSHYYLPVTGDGVAALGSAIHTPSDFCPALGALPELGGDIGGSNILKQVNNDFCADFGYHNGMSVRANLNLTFMAYSSWSKRPLVTLPPSPRRAYGRRES